ncbi:hypothetical protein IGI04_008306, partial [Brassica rapa subsp. trilocularis]
PPPPQDPLASIALPIPLRLLPSSIAVSALNKVIFQVEPRSQEETEHVTQKTESCVM